MRNFQIGAIAGIPIKLNISLLLFLPVLAWLIATGGQIEVYVDLITRVSPQRLDASTLTGAPSAYLIGVTGAVGLFVSVLAHELGHSWMARRYDITIVSITLWIFGGMARMEDIPEEWHKEFWIALAGPAVSLAIGVAGVAALQVLPGSFAVGVFVVGFLGLLNLTLVVFNLLPAFPMDGGRVLRALLARNQPYVQATQTAATVGKAMAVLMGIVGLLGRGPLLILVALFVYMAAGSESKATRVRELLRGVVVADMMDRTVPTIPANATVADLVDRVMFEGVAGFPVVDGERVVGVVTFDQVRDVAPGDRTTTMVRDVMSTDPPTVAPEQDAFDALRQFGETEGPLVVADDGRFVGVVTEADFVRTMESIQGLGPRRETQLTPDGFA